MVSTLWTTSSWMPFEEEGKVDAGQRERPQLLEATLPATAASAGRARELTNARCLQWGLAELSDDLALVVTELVANAVRHADTDITVRLARLETGVRLEVADRSPRPLRPRAAALADEGGRGLLLVDALSTRYGVEAEPDGKLVWAELALEAAG